MDPALIGPSLRDDDEVHEVNRPERQTVTTASRHQRLVLLELPAEVADRQHIMNSITQADRDQRGIVVIEGEPHARAACCRSQRACSLASTEAAHSASTSISAPKSA